MHSTSFQNEVRSRQTNKWTWNSPLVGEVGFDVPTLPVNSGARALSRSLSSVKSLLPLLAKSRRWDFTFELNRPTAVWGERNKHGGAKNEASFTQPWLSCLRCLYYVFSSLWVLARQHARELCIMMVEHKSGKYHGSVLQPLLYAR